MKKILSLVLALALALSLAACGKTTVALDKTSHTFTAADETLQLTADTKADSLTWTSSDEAVATVDSTGKVTAVAPGSATITVSAGEDATAACEVKCEWTNPVDLSAFLASLVEKYGEEFPANADLTEMPDMLEAAYPGLSAIETNQMVIFQPFMGAVVCEIALIEVANSSDVEAVKSILQGRIDAQVDGGAWYPESIDGWANNSRIEVQGNYIMMIAHMYCDEILDLFRAQF